MILDKGVIVRFMLKILVWLRMGEMILELLLLKWMFDIIDFSCLCSGLGDSFIGLLLLVMFIRYWY